MKCNTCNKAGEPRRYDNERVGVFCSPCFNTFKNQKLAAIFTPAERRAIIGHCLKRLGLIWLFIAAYWFVPQLVCNTDDYWWIEGTPAHKRVTEGVGKPCDYETEPNCELS